MKITVALLSILIFVTVFSCTQNTGNNKPTNGQSQTDKANKTNTYKRTKEQAQKIADDAATSIQQQLSALLLASITERGVAESIGFCSTKALPLTDSVAKVHNMKIQRVSAKNRNPANAASIHSMTIGIGFEDFKKNGNEVKPVVSKQTSSYLYHAPIYISNAMCLQCHGVPGKDIKPDVLAAIKANYPDDKATGFKMDDLRGMWRMEVPLEYTP